MEKDGIVSVTLAEIYLEQGYLEKAIAIYDKLVAREPYNEIHRAKLASLRKTLKEKNKPSLFRRVIRNKNR
jgi:tetratricopeptide (TPR) repeat protein